MSSLIISGAAASDRGSTDGGGVGASMALMGGAGAGVVATMRLAVGGDPGRPGPAWREYVEVRVWERSNGTGFYNISARPATIHKRLGLLSAQASIVCHSDTAQENFQMS